MSINLSEPPGVIFLFSPRPPLLFSLVKYVLTFFFYLLKPANTLSLLPAQKPPGGTTTLRRVKCNAERI